MNLLLLENTDFISENIARITGRRLNHLLTVNKISIGDTLRTGAINGLMGKATILSLSADAALLSTTLTELPPPPLNITLVLALPRPKMLRRILQTITTMGVKKIYLINTWRVEKSYWQSPMLAVPAIREQLVLGLEQGGDTTLPEVIFKLRFKPFIEDELPSIIVGSKAFVAHPRASTSCPASLSNPITLAVGPEGGFIDYEVEKLVTSGFQSITLGSRILRVETALPVLLSKLCPQI